MYYVGHFMAGFIRRVHTHLHYDDDDDDDDDDDIEWHFNLVSGHAERNPTF